MKTPILATEEDRNSGRPFFTRGLLNTTAAIGLCLLLAGCLVPRKHSALAVSAQPRVKVALLPAETEGAGRRGSPSSEKARQLANRVLDTLAKSESGSLIGPSRVLSLLGTNMVPACLSWKVEGSDLGTQSSALLAGEQLGKLLEVTQVVRCRVYAPCASATFGGGGEGIGREWSCSVVVDMELVDLNPLKVTRSSTGVGRAEQTKGLIYLIVPFYYGTTFGRAVDHAERTALTALFDTNSGSERK